MLITNPAVGNPFGSQGIFMPSQNIFFPYKKRKFAETNTLRLKRLILLRYNIQGVDGFRLSALLVFKE